MTEFKIGDWLRGTATFSGEPNGGLYEGEFRGEYATGGPLSGWPKVHEHADSSLYLDISKPITVALKLDFVGPRPEPVPSPKIVLPFEADEGFIQDNNGIYVGRIESNQLTDGQDQVLAELIVKLLNKHFEEN